MGHSTNIPILFMSTSTNNNALNQENLCDTVIPNTNQGEGVKREVRNRRNAIVEGNLSEEGKAYFAQMRRGGQNRSNNE